MVNYRNGCLLVTVASRLHNDTDTVISEHSVQCIPLHGVALNGFWIVLDADVVILVSDPFQLQSSLGW